MCTYNSIYIYKLKINKQMLGHLLRRVVTNPQIYQTTIKREWINARFLSTAFIDGKKYVLKECRISNSIPYKIIL